MECMNQLAVRLCARLRLVAGGDRESSSVATEEAPTSKIEETVDRVTMLFAAADAGTAEADAATPLAYFDDEAVCGVCADERVRYFSVGCRHAACETCWRAWLGEHDGCWLCGARVDELRRNAARRPSEESPEKPTSRAAARCEALRIAAAKVLRRLVEIKHRALELGRTTDDVDEHLRSLAAGSAQTLDAVGAVLAVEQRVLCTTLSAVISLTGGASDDTDDAAAWRALGRDVADAARCAHRASQALDAVDAPDDRLDAARDAAANIGLDIASAQWAAAKAALEDVADHKLPKYKSLLCGPQTHDSFAVLLAMPRSRRRRRNPEDPDLFEDPRAFDHALKAIKSRLSTLDATLDEVFITSQLVVARLESFFLDGKRSITLQLGHRTSHLWEDSSGPSQEKERLLQQQTMPGEEAPTTPQDLTLFVKNLLEQMQQRFETMSEQIVGRIDEMGNRIDDLEKSIAELMEQAGVDPVDANTAS
ncbi:hypothetical protein CTAYLR_002641 [Chrysophaeum taylorii]|uniref:Heat shock factor-binding protein 1 n=1 Tax=Chrysophaeum taylorii TaxID=2483200 RepID=A0AAD7UCS9_9STRA|nr:hypothetical protein CTAYLR_002641 [Chrysophaeum taylorii]